MPKPVHCLLNLELQQDSDIFPGSSAILSLQRAIHSIPGPHVILLQMQTGPWMFSFGTWEKENLAATLKVLHKNPLEGVVQLSRTKLSFPSGKSLSFLRCNFLPHLKFYEVPQTISSQIFGVLEIIVLFMCQMRQGFYGKLSI